MEKLIVEISGFRLFGVAKWLWVESGVLINLQSLLANLNLLRVAGVFAEVVAELDHFLPCTLFGNLGRREFHHDVHGFHVVDVAGEVGANAERIKHPTVDSLMDGDGFVHIQTVAEDDGLLCRVDAEFLVFIDDFLQSLVVVAAGPSNSLACSVVKFWKKALRV